MDSESIVALNEKASDWADQMREDPSYTNSDVEELKSHLLDISEDLLSKGLSAEEAFALATQLIGNPSTLGAEYEEVNTPVIQLRKAILVLSGVLVFFLLYNFIFATTHLLILAIDSFSEDYVLNFRLAVSYILAYPLLITIVTAILYFSDSRKIKLLEKLKIRPKHAFLQFLVLILLALSGEWIRNLCVVEFSPGSYTGQHLYSILLYLNIFLPLVFIVCFVTLHRKFSRTLLSQPNAFKYDLLLVFSSVLVYFFLKYILKSTSMIVIYLLQNYQNDPTLNIRKTFSYTLTFQLLFVLLTAALYFLDKNIIQRIKRLHINPIQTLWLFLATIFFAFLELLILPLAKNSLGKEMVYRRELMNVMHLSEFTFPIVLGACFLVLFYKYYRDNVKIG